MNKDFLAEFLGTFCLVFIGTSVATLQGFLDYGDTGWLGISFAFGFTLMVLVWVIGPVSGCHVNPAVTIPMAVSGRLPWSRVPSYLIAQFAGALVASGLLLVFMKYGFNVDEAYRLGKDGLAANGDPRNLGEIVLFGWELVMTALFVFVIFTATREGATPGIDGLAIGGFLLVAHLVGAQLGDSSLNPARSFGPAVIQALRDTEALKILWVFILAPVLGGLAGCWIYKRLYD